MFFSQLLPLSTKFRILLIQKNLFVRFKKLWKLSLFVYSKISYFKDNWNTQKSMTCLMFLRKSNCLLMNLMNKD